MHYTSNKNKAKGISNSNEIILAHDMLYLLCCLHDSIASNCFPCSLCNLVTQSFIHCWMLVNICCYKYVNKCDFFGPEMMSAAYNQVHFRLESKHYEA